MTRNSARSRLFLHVLLMGVTLGACKRSSTAQVSASVDGGRVPSDETVPEASANVRVPPHSSSNPPLPVGAHDARVPEEPAADAGVPRAKSVAPEVAIEVPYRGTLGSEHVVVRLTQKGSTLEGRYFQESSGVDLPLKGRIERNGTFALKEKSSSARWRGALRDDQLSGTRQLGDTKLELTAARVKQAAGPGWAPVFIATKRTPPPCSDGAQDVAKFEYPEFVGAFSPEREAEINRDFVPSEDFVRCSKDDYRKLEFRVLYDADGIASLEQRDVHFQSIVAKERAPDWSIEYRTYSLSAQTRVKFDDAFPATQSFRAIKELFQNHLAEARRTDPGLKDSKNQEAENLGLQTDNLSVEGQGVRFISRLNQTPWNGVLISYAELAEKKLVDPHSPIAPLASKHPAL